MPTFLFDNIIFGPIKSRRLGSSLGINLLSPTAKICNFDCIYCECGWTDIEGIKDKFVDKNELQNQLMQKLSNLAETSHNIDYITFAGNGEPTLHPRFEQIVDDVIALRNKWIPKTKIAVLSNATTLRKPSVLRALEKIDKRILKLDAGSDEMFQLMDKPLGKMNLTKVYEDLKSLPNKDFTIQTMFLKGQINGQPVDNTEEKEVQAWIDKLIEIKPKEVMLYTIDRDTPVDSLGKVPKKDLEVIADRLKVLGIGSYVSA